MIKDAAVVIGMGEIGSVIARGILRLGHPVIPVTRDMSMDVLANQYQKPECVVVAVGENDLQAVLYDMPDTWKDRLVLIQNELLPRDWQSHNILPTVVSVWFEKKKGQDVKVIVPSTLHGSQAAFIAEALNTLDIPTQLIETVEQMNHELVRKNYYILTSNIAGLRVGGTVGGLWENHQPFCQDVVNDVHVIQEHLLGEPLDNEQLTQAMLVAFNGDPEHDCMGRSAPARLKRALAIADQAGLAVPTLRDIREQDL